MPDLLRRNSLVTPILSCVAIVALSGGQFRIHAADSIKVTRAFSGKTAGNATSSVTVDVPIGDVTVKAGPADLSEVTVQGTLGGGDQATLDTVKVTIVRQNADVSIKATGPQGKAWEADLTIVVPPKLNLNVTAGVGNTSISGVNGSIKATSDVGNVIAENIILGGDGTFTSSTGNITIRPASWPKDRSLKAESGVGNATVHVPTSLGFNLDASTGVGSLKISGVELDRGVKRAKSVVGGSAQGRTKADPEGRRLAVKSSTGTVTVDVAPAGK